MVNLESAHAPSETHSENLSKIPPDFFDFMTDADGLDEADEFDFLELVSNDAELYQYFLRKIKPQEHHPIFGVVRWVFDEYGSSDDEEEK